MRILHEVPPPQPKNKFVALDVEIFNLNSKQLHRPTSGKFACLSVATDPETVYVITDQLQLPVVFSNLRDAVHIYHHAKFDITHLRRWVNIEPRKRLWDTMLIERIMWGGYFDFFALEHLARRWLDIKMDKSLQKSFEHATELTEKQIAEHIRDGDWAGKAGAYGIQETGDEFVERIEGSFTNVIGMPMELTQCFLKRLL